MFITPTTRIAAILKHRPDALDAIVSISPKFEKLRNPFLRKVMAGKASIAMASKITGCSVDDFYNKLKPFGFESIDSNSETLNVEEETAEIPGWVATAEVVTLDVRPILSGGADPFKIIMSKLKELTKSQALKIINTFEPVPLINILSKQGYESYTDEIADDHVETWFYRTAMDPGATIVKDQLPSNDDWDEILLRFGKNLQTVDVRHLEMPAPMMTILDELERLPDGKALFVYHKRIPMFLLPELNERGFEYRFHEISEGDVHMVIFRP